MLRSRVDLARFILIGTLFLACGSVSFGRVSVKTLPELVKMSPVIAYGRIASPVTTSTAGRDWVQFESLEILKGSSSLSGKEISLCRSPPPMTDYPDISKWAGYEVILFLSRRQEGCFELSHSYVAVVEVRDGVAETSRIEKQPERQPSDKLLNKIKKEVARQKKVAETEK